MDPLTGLIVGIIIGALAAVIAHRVRQQRLRRGVTTIVGTGEGSRMVLRDGHTGADVGTLQRPAAEGDPIPWRCAIADCSESDAHSTAPTTETALLALSTHYKLEHVSTTRKAR